MAVVWEWLSCQKVIKLTPAHHEALPALKDWSYGLADRGPAWQWQPGDIRPVIPRQQGQSPWAMAEGAVYFFEECPGGSWNVARGTRMVWTWWGLIQGITGLFGESESEIAQSCPTLCHPMDCSPLGSSVHGVFQARIGVGCHFLLQKIFLTHLKRPWCWERL